MEREPGVLPGRVFAKVQICYGAQANYPDLMRKILFPTLKDLFAFQRGLLCHRRRCARSQAVFVNNFVMAAAFSLKLLMAQAIFARLTPLKRGIR